MNSLEIGKYMKKIHHALEWHVFAANRIPVHMTAPVYIISNLDPDNKPGSHWVAIHINTDGVGEYFDTFGRKPTSHHLSFLCKNTKKWIYNSNVIQSVFSSLCGQYCLLYLYFKLRGMSLNDFICMFSDNTIYNDVLLLEMFNVFCNN